jgi:hypothetical protein
MKKLAYVCLCLPFFGAAQSNDSSLQEGKILFRNTDTIQTNISLKKEQLTKALHIFEKALVESPQKSEAHYFCGYGIDRLYILNEQDSATSDFIMPATYAGTEQELPKKVVARDKMLDENMENMRQLLDKN